MLFLILINTPLRKQNLNISYCIFIVDIQRHNSKAQMCNLSNQPPTQTQTDLWRLLCAWTMFHIFELRPLKMWAKTKVLSIHLFFGCLFKICRTSLPQLQNSFVLRRFYLQCSYDHNCASASFLQLSAHWSYRINCTAWIFKLAWWAPVDFILFQGGGVGVASRPHGFCLKKRIVLISSPTIYCGLHFYFHFDQCQHVSLRPSEQCAPGLGRC